jgi:hypothetical protein
MVTPSQGGEMKLSHANDNIEEIPGLHVEVLHNREELKSHRQEIVDHLRYNVANDTFSPTGQATETKGHIKHLEAGLRHSSLHGGEHELVLAAMDGKKMLGFLAIKLTEAGKKAEIVELLTRTRDRAQRAVVAKLLHAAKHHMAEESFRHLVANTDSPGDPLVAAMRNDPGFQYFLQLHKKTTETPSAANDDMEPYSRAA